MRKTVLCLMTLALCLLLAPGLAESARVDTGGGYLNLRAKPDRSARALLNIPNGATVELLESEQDGYYRVTYKGKKGYVMAKYLRVGESGEEQTVYPDDANQVLPLREKADENSKVLFMMTYATPMRVLSYDGDFAKVSCSDADGASYVGYIKASSISLSRDTPVSGAVFGGTAYRGTMKQAQKLYEWPDATSAVCATLPKDMHVTVQSVDGAWAYVMADVYVGYVPSGAVSVSSESAPPEQYAYDEYTAGYYTATANDGTLALFVEPTANDVTGARQTLEVGKDTKLTVLTRSQTFGGKQWSLVSDGTNTGWVLSNTLKFSKDLEEYDYPVTVPMGAVGVAYAKKGGAHLYKEGSSLSPLLATVKEGEEVAVTLHSGYVSATYQGKHGYIPASELVFGFVNVAEWHYTNATPAPTQTPSPMATDVPGMEKSRARALADAALKSAYPAFSADGMTVTGDKFLRKGSIEGPFFEFGYYKDGRYVYMCIVHAQTGETLRTADYTDFMPAQTAAPATATPKKSDEISASKARGIADDALSAKYAAFDASQMKVQRARYTKKPGIAGPLYQFDYYLNDAYSYCCMVHAKTGKVLYIANRHDPNLTELDLEDATPAPVYESTTDIGQSAARGIADKALRGKYPEFGGATFSRVNCRVAKDAVDFESPYYQFDYYVDGDFVYCCIVHAYTGRVLYTYGNLAGEGNG